VIGDGKEDKSYNRIQTDRQGADGDGDNGGWEGKRMGIKW